MSLPLINFNCAEIVMDRIIGTLDSMSIRTALVQSAVPRIVDYLIGRLPNLDSGFPSRLRAEQPRLFDKVMQVCRRHVVIAYNDWGVGNNDSDGRTILPANLIERFEPTPTEIAAGLITVKGLEKRQNVTIALPSGYAASAVTPTTAT